MAHQVLYRAYRPSSFSEVVGQEYIVKTLQNSIKKNNIAHAYLFCGPRGTGKTSVAKIFAKAINCTKKDDDACNECESCLAANQGNNPDIIELDAASNNSVENIREIIKNINFMPVNGKYKVYIIDEVHMLSTSAFNAFLKTLEEPPEHVIFILATTEPNKVIPTVLSRCQRYNFAKLRQFEIKERMIQVLNNEKIAFEDKALDVIASLADGGMRDALSLLEQYLSYNSESVNLKDTEKLFSLSQTKDKIDLLLNTHNGNIQKSIATLREMYQNGIDLNRLANELLEIVKEAIIYSEGNNSDDLLEKINKAEASTLIQNIGNKKLIDDLQILEDLLNKVKPNQGFISYLEVGLIKMSSDSHIKYVEPKNEDQKVIKEVTKNETKEESKTANNIEKPIEKETNLDELLNILKSATKEEKINDEIIVNRIEMYRYDENYRKFFVLLNEAKLFASSEDALIFETNESSAKQINDLEINKDLYNFISKTYNTHKMVYAITLEEKNRLIEMYRNLKPEEKTKVTKVKKYEEKKELSKEDKLKEAFGEIKVVD